MPLVTVYIGKQRHEAKSKYKQTLLLEPISNCCMAYNKLKHLINSTVNLSLIVQEPKLEI